MKLAQRTISKLLTEADKKKSAAPAFPSRLPRRSATLPLRSAFRPRPATPSHAALCPLPCPALPCLALPRLHVSLYRADVGQGGEDTTNEEDDVNLCVTGSIEVAAGGTGNENELPFSLLFLDPSPPPLPLPQAFLTPGQGGASFVQRYSRGRLSLSLFY